MHRNLSKTIEKRGRTANRNGQIRGSIQLFAIICLSILVVLGVFFYSQSTETGAPLVTEKPSASTSSGSVAKGSEKLAKSLERSEADPDSETDVTIAGQDQSIFQTTLVVEVTGFRSELGDCLVAIYDSSTSFNKIEQSIIRESKKIVGDSVQFEFAVLGNKSIAIAAFHDENRNGMLDKNAFGIPTEHYGFSNNPPSTFGPPSFSAAAIQDPMRVNGRVKIVLGGLNLSGSK